RAKLVSLFRTKDFFAYLILKNAEAICPAFLFYETTFQSSCLPHFAQCHRRRTALASIVCRRAAGDGTGALGVFLRPAFCLDGGGIDFVRLWRLCFYDLVENAPARKFKTLALPARSPAGSCVDLFNRDRNHAFRRRSFQPYTPGF